MEFLDTDQFLVDIVNKQEKIVGYYNELMDIHKSLKEDALSPEQYEKMYEKEFKVAISMSGTYNDLEKMLNQLHKQVPEQRFFVNRVQGEISLYKIWETIEI